MVTQKSQHTPSGVVFIKNVNDMRFSAYQIHLENIVQFSHSVASNTLPWTTACQASLSITSCWSLPKPMSIELVMPSNHLILCCPLLLLPSIFPSIRVFQMSQLFASDGQSTGVSTSTSVLPMTHATLNEWFFYCLYDTFYFETWPNRVYTM